MDALVDVGLVAIGLLGLFYGGNLLVKGAARLASTFGISDVLIGLTVVAFGTSAPELLVSLSAALSGTSDIAIGNVVGSNIANIGLILGLTALIAPIAVNTQLTRREIPLMIAVSVGVYLLVLDKSVSRGDGALLVGGFLAFTLLSAVLARRDEAAIKSEIHEYEDHERIIDADPQTRLRDLGMIVLGIALLAGGAQALVTGAADIAAEMGVSDLVIGITLVAFGTSLPELTTSIIAATRGENDIAVGNVVGSNVANLLLILGATALVEPVGVGRELLRVDFPVMLVYAALLLPFSFDRTLNRIEAGAFLVGYVVFTVFLFVR